MEFRAGVHLLACAALLGGARADARVLLTQKDALALAFPAGTTVERKTAALTDAQAAAVEKDAQGKLDSRIWSYYEGRAANALVGTAYFESHRVRTMNETLMVVVDPDDSVRFVEVLSFAEPDDYLAPRKWLDQFHAKKLDEDLFVRRGLRNVTGASLTSEAVTRAVRRVLAVHRVLHPAAK